MKDFLKALRETTSTVDDIAPYTQDPRGRFVGQALAVVKPDTVHDLSAVVRLCHQHDVCVIPFAGGTGLVGGQTHLTDRPAIVVSVERLNTIRDCNAQTMTVEAGCILADVHARAEQDDMQFPLWMASQGSARIGGLLATNAGGLHVLKYGMARDLCLGLEAVMADGRVLNTLTQVRKNNTGYDLKNLLIGSEGTLGIITAATLKLVPRPQAVETAFCAVTSPEQALALFAQCQQAGALLSAFELISAQGFDFFNETNIGLTPPCEASAWYVLIEFSGADIIPVRDILEATLLNAQAHYSDAVIAQTDAQRQNLWAIRENLPEANRRIGSVSSHDIAVPIPMVPTFIPQMQQAIHALDATLRTHIFGHVGDGNLHANVFPAKGKTRKDYETLRTAIKQTVHDLVHDLGGAISAEHGIGRIKVEDLYRYADATKLDVMHRIKQAVDPKNLLNPGAVFKE